MFVFWQYCFEKKYITIDQLVFVVKREENSIGDLTKEEYKKITGLIYPATK